MQQDATGGRDATFPTIKWVDGEPTRTDGTANQYIIVNLIYNGSIYFGQATSWFT